MSMFSRMKRLFGSVREYKKPTVLTLILIILEVIIEVLIPVITADLVNKIKDGAELSLIIRTGALLAGMAMLSLLCGGIAGASSAKASAGFAANLRHDLFSKVQAYSFENIDRFSSASLVTRLTTDITYVQMAFMMVIRVAVRAPLMLLFAIIMASIMGGPLAATFVVVIPLLACGLYFVSRKAMPAFHRVFKKYDKLNETVEENVRAMRVVKGFSREDYEKEKFAKASEDIRKDFVKAERIVAFNNPLMQFCVYFNLIFIMTVGAYVTISNTNSPIDVGQISAMLTYAFQILMQLMMLSMIYVMLTISSESMKRVGEVLDEEPTITSSEGALTEVSDGSVEFDNVSFKFSALARRHSLENASFRIESGMTVGIIGGTGSGKSSVVQLIPRLYDTTEGVVRVGGRDVRDYDLDTLRGAVAMVLQKNLLFTGTIAENLRWGNPDATDEELREACELAQAAEFIDSFPEGYETKIEQGGTNVSGGQKQRLCIARALLKKPKILILDDSTSAVDMKTDAKIRKGFKEFIPETTKIIIAQRYASVEDADMIIVLDGGHITDIGTHAELLETSKIYREVYDQQCSAGKAGDLDE